MAVSFQNQLLAKVRIELGLTQEEAARSVGIDVRTYRRYESGEVNEGGGFALQRASRRKILQRIAREFGIAEGDLLASPEEVPQETPRFPTSLPRARHFVGRADEIARLRGWLADAGGTRVVAVVGVGGAGKTSLVERVLETRQGGEAAFVHSFYDDPAVDAFLDAAIGWFDPAGGGGGAKGGDRLARLSSAVARTKGALLVLDGLEVVQAQGHEDRARGELEDPRLVRLLRSLVRSTDARVLVTSRLPLADLAAFEGDGLLTIALPPLTESDSLSLLRLWGLSGTPAALLRVHAAAGGHALSVSVAGSYVGAFLGGDPEKMIDLDLDDAAKDDPLARRLQALLVRYGEELSPLDRDVVGRVCLFPRGVDEETIQRLASAPSRIAGRLGGATPSRLRASLSRLVHQGLLVKQATRFAAHPFVREQFRSLAVDEAPAIHALERDRLSAHLSGRPRVHVEPSASKELLDTYEALFEHTLLAGDAAEAYAILERTLGGFSHLGLRLGEFERGLRMVRALAAEESSFPASYAFRLSYDRGLYSAALGDLPRAAQAYEASLERDLDGVTTRRTLGYTYWLMGRFEEALEQVASSIALARAAGLTAAEARGLALRAAIFTSEGRLEEATQGFCEARMTGDAPRARRAIWEAEYLLAAGDVPAATLLTVDNLAWCAKRGWEGHVAHCHVVLGHAALASSDAAAAKEHLRTAQRWPERTGEVELLLRGLLLEAAVARAEGKGAAATRAKEKAREIATSGSYGLILRSLEHPR